MELIRLFRRCLNRTYTHVENSADFSLERAGSELYIYFQSSDGATDWRNNLDFPAKAYDRPGDIKWYAHSGFLKVWKTVEDYISADVKDDSVRKIVIVGYSHGAALAVLCHEYSWYCRPDLRDSLEGYGFGCPRVIWGLKPKSLKRRWDAFTVVRNLDDIVTHLPPAVLGYSHVGKLLEIGKIGKYSRVDAHRPESYLAELSTLS